MLISEIGIRGYKSFGNNEQVVKLNTESGELVLLVGKNGNGKSSLLESFEYTLYGKVKSGKTKKWHKLSTLPNRINGELLNRIKFISNSTEVEVKRGISPNVLELVENGVLNERAGKANVDEKIEKYIGMDIETFKSFISMSINDFKNFISLTNEEKQLLLDKLFNLEVINILNSILKDINKNNKVRMASLDSEIRTLDESIDSIKKSIEKAIEREKQEAQLALEREKEDIQSEIDRITNEMNSKKDDYKSLKEKIEKIKSKENELSEDLDVEKKQYINTQNDIKNVQREIDLYDSGKCPTCRTDFNSDHFVNLRTTLVEKKSGFENVKIEIEDNIRKVKERQTKLKELSDKTTTAFNDLNYLLKNYKSEIDKLVIKKESQKIPTNSTPSVNVQEFQNTILELEDKKSISQEGNTICKEKEMYYKELNRILSEDGVKKAIISGIIKPINHFVSENVKQMMLPFDVKLDETFTAEIKSLGVPIEHDSLSTGETKKINIAILIAYLKLIRTKKHINILFLDEVFSSIDLEGIDSILMLLKSFANDYNINIFVVHHAILSEEMFDKILKINKEVFTSIEEVVYEG
jgi:DNA repair exonuclease SbcCD ATPase subunit